MKKALKPAIHTPHCFITPSFVSELIRVLRMICNDCGLLDYFFQRLCRLQYA